jgi:hypothetical protein
LDSCFCAGGHLVHLNFQSEKKKVENQPLNIPTMFSFNWPSDLEEKVKRWKVNRLHWQCWDFNEVMIIDWIKIH